MASGELPAEARARRVIDSNLAAAGWVVQNRSETNLKASQGVAIREVPMGDGVADYLLP
jgi:type I restriction enzyme R subunit